MYLLYINMYFMNIVAFLDFYVAPAIVQVE